MFGFFEEQQRSQDGQSKVRAEESGGEVRTHKCDSPDHVGLRYWPLLEAVLCDLTYRIKNRKSDCSAFR